LDGLNGCYSSRKRKEKKRLERGKKMKKNKKRKKEKEKMSDPAHYTKSSCILLHYQNILVLIEVSSSDI
jgi:hypothetical protein